jgi:acyl-CoA reductase-like NAD-dependent aldehyde dehydrogenase
MPTDLFIGGAYRSAAHDARFQVIEPATERELAQVAIAAEQDVADAVEAARAAADSGPWPTMNAEARARVLNRIADGIEQRARERGTLEARNVGKPVSECVSHDIARAAKNIRFFAAAAETWTQEASFSDAKFLGADLKLMSVTARSPLGVGAIIIPWNSPLMLATWNLGPCLATGNACVLKPSELAPLTSLALGEIAAEAGLPPGVLNVITGLGATGAAMVNHPGVDAIAFTGGVGTGRSRRRAINLSQPGSVMRRRLAPAGRSADRR